MILRNSGNLKNSFKVVKKPLLFSGAKLTRSFMFQPLKNMITTAIAAKIPAASR